MHQTGSSAKYNNTLYMVPLFSRPDDNSKYKDKGNMKTHMQTSTVNPDSIEARDSSDEEI